MSKLIIVEGNSNDKDNTRAFMVKGESGTSPTLSASRSGTTTTVTMTDYEGTHTFDVEDGVSPTVATSKENGVTTVTITDASGTHTATINDGEVSEAELEAGLATKFDKTGGTITSDVDVQGVITANSSRVITRGDFALINGTLTMTDGVASDEVNYPTSPTGVPYNSTNCVVLSFMAHNSTSTASVSNYGYTEKSIGYSSGAIGHRIGLKTDKIAININNPMADTGTATFEYTIVLMKVSW